MTLSRSRKPKPPSAEAASAVTRRRQVPAAPGVPATPAGASVATAPMASADGPVAAAPRRPANARGVAALIASADVPVFTTPNTPANTPETAGPVSAEPVSAGPVAKADGPVASARRRSRPGAARGPTTRAAVPPGTPPPDAAAWFESRGWTPFPFQREVWAAMAAGRSGLLHASTGSGKTYAVWWGALQRGLRLAPLPTGRAPLGVLWLTPMRALAADTARALQLPIDELGIDWSVGQRTGDTPSAERARQDRHWPSALITTPESLSLMLTRADSPERLAGVHTVVVDEWHELMGSKRGVQVQLALARLRRWNPALAVWGLSATLGNLDEAMQVLVGVNAAHDTGTAASTNADMSADEGAGKSAAMGADTSSDRSAGAGAGTSADKSSGPSADISSGPSAEMSADMSSETGAGAGTGAGTSAVTNASTKAAATPVAAVLVQGRIDKRLRIDTLLPDNPGRFSWGGHLGRSMQLPVVAEIERSGTTLVFCNTRSQSEIWYQLLIALRPDWAGLIALHHGSLDKSVREWVEAGLKAGTLKAVVATSSLDLGVDFLPVERVLQIGSAKGVARLLQRAGRSGHAPGRDSRITLVPTNTLELIEAAAARRAAMAGRIEKRDTPRQPFDVLVQHLVTVALGGGFEAEAMYAEVRSAYAYRALTRDEFQWALDFVENGGASLGAYPEYHRIRNIDGVFRVPEPAIAKRHRLQVGTIVGDATMQVSYLGGGRLGTMEESFIARLRAGDRFVFGGRVLEFIRTKDMTAYVRKATKPGGIVPIWNGGKMPLSSELADAVLELLEAVRANDPAALAEPEMQAAAPMLRTQAQLSRLPTRSTLLIERYASREGQHLYLYPFAGRNVHLGLAGLLAWRLAREAPNTFSISVNDYGFELLSAEPVDIAGLLDASLFDVADLLGDVLASLNSRELAQRRFREIARIAGLIFQGYPGAPKSSRQLQASSGLFYEVFRQHDASNLLLTQAQSEVLSQELEIGRLRQSLERIQRQTIDFVELKAPSPFSLPLLVERLREKLSTEKLADRLARIVRDAERVADR